MDQAQDHHWITLHRIRFASPVSAHERQFPPVRDADVWRFCPQHSPGPDGLVTLVSDIWGGMGIWNSRAEAEAMLARPDRAMPWLSEAVASWHCLALPVGHRGEVNWRGHIEDGTAIRPSPSDPGGALIVVTSAGFTHRDAANLPRIKRFVEGVSEVMGWFTALPSNIRNDVFNGPDGREGFTLSLWQSDAAMRETAYHPGRHRGRMDEYRDGALMDRSSFTRLRAVVSHGDWDGDPLSETG